jgi:cyclophilin family peptidyl-prolyl cis-trans isomerase
MTRAARALIAAALLLTAEARAGELTELARQRVVLHTVAGDLALECYPNAAPETVEQFLRLVRAGIYDTTAFARIQPGFIAQVSSAQDRLQPLTADQATLLHRLPLEASGLKHVRGVLSLAHPDGDLGGGESSFCIMLGPAPQLDGRYTIFGQVAGGSDVLAAMLQVPRSNQMVPSVRLTIDRAEVFDTPEAWSHVYLTPGHPVRGAVTASSIGPIDAQRESLLSSGLLLIVLLAATSAILRRRLKPQAVSSLNLIVLLVGSFLLFVLLLPVAQRRPLLAAALLLGLVSVFKALGKFEMAVKDETKS